MSTVRRDIFTGQFVIISELRAKRPMRILQSSEISSHESTCPFCPGNESITPQELFKDSDDWSIRSFPNKYPALDWSIRSFPNKYFTLDEGNPSMQASFFYGDYDGEGEHEVLVDTRSHEESMCDFSEAHLEKLLKALKGRYIHYDSISETKYIQIFKNNGIKAGATQKHSHWQIVAGRFVPSVQTLIGNSLFEHRQKTNNCLYCEFIDNEITAKERIICENELFLAIAPYASRFTYETWILPKAHYSSFSELTDHDLELLPDILKKIFSSLGTIIKGLDFNLLFMDSPKTERKPMYHWHIQILPRLGNLAGYEFATGSYINHITPEKAASDLKMK